ncbi:MAG: murein biosynthesis integral membrane protein MurJ [candidate division WOR-3 bacterium]|nr:murein biosynthesis integral membrane protein MurJ [candidate division WOR-3 bacterium]MCX7757949.1 murein biosynthesis integral membrane protein MurJ [candidate division WOR-3 bacterium]MDW7987296.1 murein biosynthesis integral membrane protein MurJ [candidate division WOR-3 bacterium]
MFDKFTRRVGSFTAGTLISRILGLIRESVFAYLFGAGFATDAFQVAFRIPNLFRDLFAESALSSAFVPTFVDNLVKKDRKEVWRFASNVFNTLFIVVGVIVVLGMIFAPALVKVLAYGFKEVSGKQELTSTLTRIMLPFLLFVALASWAMGVLNAFKDFFLPALAPALFNLGSVLVAIFSYRYFVNHNYEPILGMAYGVTIGACFQFLIQIPSLIKKGFKYSFYVNFKDPELRRVLMLWIPTILGLASYQINFAVNTFLVTFLEERSITYLNYAYRIMHLPAGLFGVAVGSVAIAEFSSKVAEETSEVLKEQLRHALKLVSLLTLPISALFLALAIPITRIIYEHGKFTPQDTLYTAQALMLYAPGIFAQAGVRSIAACFYALKDTKTPALVGLSIVVVNFLINRSLMTVIGFRTFPLATSLCAFLNFGILSYFLKKKIGSWGSAQINRVVLLTFCYAVISAIISFWVFSLLSKKILAFNFINQLITLGISGIIGLGIFFGLVSISKITF